MDLKFADRIKGLAPSAVREILKYSSLPGFISFSAGSPASEAFPSREFAQITNRLLNNSPNLALNYSVTNGYEPLKSWVREYLPFGDDNDEVIITSGAQQVMDLACKALCNEGDIVITESPSFIGALNSFRSFGTRLIGVEMKKDGMDTEELERVLSQNDRVKLIYTIPNFHNPTGYCTSLEKRKKIYALAKKYGVMIIEDNPYGDIRFEGENIPSIKSFDEDNIVIYAGTFSKILAPGLRVGYALADKKLVEKMGVCKQTSDVHSAILSQLTVYEFVKGYDLSAHLEKIRCIYKDKAHFAMNEIKAQLSDFVEFEKIEGGLFIWCKLKSLSMQDFCKRCSENKVGIVPGTAFSINGEDSDYFRINYSSPSKEDIVKGVGILRKVAEGSLQ